MAAGSRTRGHPAATAAIDAMVRGRTPHAILLVGPAGVGKTTLARDLAAGLLCAAALPDRPCGACRPCRLVAGDVHPDVHRLTPEGPGQQVTIGGVSGRPRGIRDLISELALLAVEGGARIGMIESAQRMNEDAQAALLKTLEEPAPGVILVLCADSEEPLLPTIRSRCARLRLGPVGVRTIEAILVEQGVADAPTAARLARVAEGRPGVALAWAADAEALVVRDEVGRTLLDLLDAGPAERLAAVRAAVPRAERLADVGTRPTAEPPPVTGGRRRTGGRAAATSTPAPPTPMDDAPDGDEGEVAATRTPATERRRAADALVLRWTDLARDLALCQHGVPGSVRDLALLDDTTAAAARLDPVDVTAFLDRLGAAGVRIRGNVSPELVLDDLAVHWPRPAFATGSSAAASRRAS
jgi:DNA polymerase III delta' subunit